MNKVVTENEFVEILRDTPAGTIVLSTITEPKMKKGGTKGTELNPYYDREVRKHKRSQYLFGKNYIDSINEGLIKEGKDTVTAEEFGDKLPWGEYEIQDRVVTYNGSRYIRCYLHEDSQEFIVYKLDGVDMTDDEYKKLEPYIPVNTSSSKKQESFGLSKANHVRPLLFKFDNIESIEIDGVTYELKK